MVKISNFQLTSYLHVLIFLNRTFPPRSATCTLVIGPIRVTRLTKTFTDSWPLDHFSIDPHSFFHNANLCILIGRSTTTRIASVAAAVFIYSSTSPLTHSSPLPAILAINSLIFSKFLQKSSIQQWTLPQSRAPEAGAAAIGRRRFRSQ